MMTAPLLLTVYRSQFTMRYQFTVIRDPWLTLWNASTLAGYADSTGLIVNGKCMVNSKLTNALKIDNCKLIIATLKGGA